MADYITKIRTGDGDLPISFDHLWNKPTPVVPSNRSTTGQFADARAVYDQIEDVNERITEIQGGDALAGITINDQKFTNGKLTLAPSHIGAAAEEHKHAPSDITDPITIQKGGTGATNGKEGLKNLLSGGHLILSEYQYGDRMPGIPETSSEREAMKGRIFFLKVQK